MLLINNNDVSKVLDMKLCLESLDNVFQEMARGEAVGMGRIDIYVPSAQQQATVAELVPEVVLVQSGVVGALDRAASDDRLQKE